MREHCDLPWMVDFSVLRVSLFATFSLVGLWYLRWVKPRFFPQHAVHTVPVEQGSTEQWLLLWEVIPQAASTTVEGQAARRGGDCPRDLPQRIYLPAGSCQDGGSPADTARRKVKEERKSRSGEGLDMVPLTVPLGRGSQVVCRHPALPLQWNGRGISPLQHWGTALG